VLAFIITGDFKLSLSLGGIDVFVKIFSYSAFDLFWHKTIFNYKPCVIWMTGLSGAGKTTIAKLLFKKLTGVGAKCILLDGDEIRKIVPPPVGFSIEERIKHNVSVGYMASIFEKQGYIVIVSMISPFAEARDSCRKMCARFIETYISTPLSVCESRDVKGLYVKARRGEIKEFTGIDSPYEKPERPELIIDTARPIGECVKKILHKI